MVTIALSSSQNKCCDEFGPRIWCWWIWEQWQCIKLEGLNLENKDLQYVDANGILSIRQRHFAHGSEEARDSSPPDPKQGIVPPKTSTDTVVLSVTLVPHPDSYRIRVPSQRLPNVIQKTGQRIHQKWKGPDKTSKIYGDWIDDFE